MSPRALAAALIVALASLLSIGRMFVQVSDFYAAAPSPDGVSEFTGRYDSLRAMLPKNGVIGYMTDDGTPPGDTTAQAEYHLTQYAVAPVLVLRATDQRYVIGNFHRPVSTGFLRDRGFKLIREFGNGIVLLENEKVR